MQPASSTLLLLLCLVREGERDREGKKTARFFPFCRNSAHPSEKLSLRRCHVTLHPGPIACLRAGIRTPSRGLSAGNVASRLEARKDTVAVLLAAPTQAVRGSAGARCLARMRSAVRSVAPRACGNGQGGHRERRWVGEGARSVDGIRGSVTGGGYYRLLAGKTDLKMPLFGEIVVIKRNGSDGTHFPLTATTCLFGRKAECDIRIQLPHVSKEHCRVEIKENKEVFATNLSIVNPTQLNGRAIQQPVRLKHGDVLTIIDRSFRFEEAGSKPVRRRSTGLGSETYQVLPNEQHSSADETVMWDSSRISKGPRKSEGVVSKSTHTRRSLQISSSKHSKDLSPFSELYEMFKSKVESKKSKSPVKKTGGSPKNLSDNILQAENVNQSSFTPKRISRGAKAKFGGPEVLLDAVTNDNGYSSKSPSRGRRSFLARQKSNERSENNAYVHMEEVKADFPLVQELPSNSKQVGVDGENKARSPRQSRSSSSESHVSSSDTSIHHGEKKSEKHSPRRSSSGPTVNVGTSVPDSHSPRQRKGKQAEQPGEGKVVSSSESSPVQRTDRSLTQTLRSSPQAQISKVAMILQDKTIAGGDPGASPRSRRVSQMSVRGASPKAMDLNTETTAIGSKKSPRKRRSGELALPEPPMKRKRVSFGGHLSPELFDKRLPPNSPLKRGATPARRSLSISTPRAVIRKSFGLKQSVIKEMHDLQSLRVGSPSITPDKKYLATGSRISTTTASNSITQSNISPIKTPSRRSSALTLAQPYSAAKSPIRASSVTTPAKTHETVPASVPTKISPAKRSPKASLSKTLVKKSPIKTTPVKSPAKRSPAKATPAKSPAKASPAKSPLKRSPAKATPAKSPLKRSPAKATPAKSPAKRSPAKATPAKSPLKRSPAKATPAKSPAKRSPAKATPAKRSPAKATPAKRSPAKATPAKRTPATASPAISYTKGRFSISRINTPPKIADHVSTAQGILASRTPKSSRKSSTLKKTPRRSRKLDVLEMIRARRRTGASEANLLLARSWADVVKIGVAKPQKKNDKPAIKVKRRKHKVLKTPAKKIKAISSTGHADSPATILIGRAHTRSVNLIGHVPKVVRNQAAKITIDKDESFTGISELFTTPVSNKQRRSARREGNATGTPRSVSEMSEMKTPEESGEMVVSPINSQFTTQRKKYSRDAVSRLLRSPVSPELLKVNKVIETTSTVFQSETIELEPALTKTQESKKDKGTSISKEKRKSIDLTGIKKIMKTPKQKGKPVTDPVALKKLLRTPKYAESLPVVYTRRSSNLEDFVGTKNLMKTPKQKGEPVQDMAGIKRIMKTPRQKGEPVEDLSGIKHIMRTPRQRGEPVEDMIGIKRIMTTPKEKGQPVEDMVGISRIMSTPTENTHPIEEIFGIKQLIKTPPKKSNVMEQVLTSGDQVQTESNKSAEANVDAGSPNTSCRKSSKRLSLTGPSISVEVQPLEENDVPSHGVVKSIITGRRGRPSKSALTVGQPGSDTPKQQEKKTEELKADLSPKNKRTPTKLAQTIAEKRKLESVSAQTLEDSPHSGGIADKATPRKVGRPSRSSLSQGNNIVLPTDVHSLEVSNDQITSSEISTSKRRSRSSLSVPNVSISSQATPKRQKITEEVKAQPSPKTKTPGKSPEAGTITLQASLETSPQSSSGAEKSTPRRRGRPSKSSLSAQSSAVTADEPNLATPKQLEKKTEVKVQPTPKSKTPTRSPAASKLQYAAVEASLETSQQSDSKADNSTPRRGRPSKSRQADLSLSAQVEEPNLATPKQLENKTEEVKVQQTPKTKRTPTKSPEASKLQYATVEASLETSQQSDSKADDITPRRRGRPSKSSQADLSSSAQAREPSLATPKQLEKKTEEVKVQPSPKTKRTPAKSPEASKLQYVAVEASLETSSPSKADNSTHKRRGRPSKRRQADLKTSSQEEQDLDQSTQPGKGLEDSRTHIAPEQRSTRGKLSNMIPQSLEQRNVHVKSPPTKRRVRVLTEESGSTQLKPKSAPAKSSQESLRQSKRDAKGLKESVQQHSEEITEDNLDKTSVSLSSRSSRRTVQKENTKPKAKDSVRESTSAPLQRGKRSRTQTSDSAVASESTLSDAQPEHLANKSSEKAVGIRVGRSKKTVVHPNEQMSEANKSALTEAQPAQQTKKSSPVGKRVGRWAGRSKEPVEEANAQLSEDNQSKLVEAEPDKLTEKYSPAKTVSRRAGRSKKVEESNDQLTGLKKDSLSTVREALANSTNISDGELNPVEQKSITRASRRQKDVLAADNTEIQSKKLRGRLTSPENILERSDAASLSDSAVNTKMSQPARRGRTARKDTIVSTSEGKDHEETSSESTSKDAVVLANQVGNNLLTLKNLRGRRKNQSVEESTSLVVEENENTTLGSKQTNTKRSARGKRETPPTDVLHTEINVTMRHSARARPSQPSDEQNEIVKEQTSKTKSVQWHPLVASQGTLPESQTAKIVEANSPSIGRRKGKNKQVVEESIPVKRSLRGTVEENDMVHTAETSPVKAKRSPAKKVKSMQLKEVPDEDTSRREQDRLTPTLALGETVTVEKRGKGRRTNKSSQKDSSDFTHSEFSAESNMPLHKDISNQKERQRGALSKALDLENNEVEESAVTNRRGRRAAIQAYPQENINESPIKSLRKGASVSESKDSENNAPKSRQGVKRKITSVEPINESSDVAVLVTVSSSTTRTRRNAKNILMQNEYPAKKQKTEAAIDATQKAGKSQSVSKAKNEKAAKVRTTRATTTRASARTKK
ncbi:proliferation marker Ki-67 [Pelobates cultripes]|uniref:Proliferation marker Ki-67 n=1 Tax=Pelobates cultripes TaxID=61616 RepID=A0AAD1WU14_PELCU|nr:proliferation marker Ki-67 [Pelobates cultripes]